MSEKEELMKKIEDNTVLFPTMTIEELEGLIRKILREENEMLYKRIAGHFHKNDDVARDIASDIEDLKIFVRTALKNDQCS